MNTLFRPNLAGFMTIISVVFILASAGSANSASDQLGKAASLLRNRQNQEALNAALSAPAGGQRSMIAGVAAFKAARFEEAIPLLADAERNYPILADYASSYRAEALLNLKRYREAVAVANSPVIKGSRSVSVVRRMEKLAADGLFEAGDIKGAMQGYQAFLARHALGRDSVDARYQSARCKEMTGDRAGAIAEYRAIWLNHPASQQAEKAHVYLKGLEKGGNIEANSFSADDLLRRADLLMIAGRHADAGWALAAIPRTGISDETLAHIELKSGQVAMKQRQYSLAEKFLARAAGTRNQQVKDEVRLALARAEIKTGKTDKALSRLFILASERGPLADDALLQVGVIHKQSGRLTDSVKVMERLLKEFPASELASRAAWEMAWSRYLAGDFAQADDGFRRLLKDDAYRERSLYWHGRSLERQNRQQDADRQFKTLLNDYPFGYYSALRREHTRQPAAWEQYNQGLPEPSFPPETEKIQALALCGMTEEVRTEVSALKGRINDKAQAMPGIARLQQLAGDYHGAIATFHQNRPKIIDRSNVAVWAMGYPRHYGDLFSRNATANRLSEAMVFSLAKAESNFTAGVKSHAGAIGLMQLMPATARMTARYKGKSPFNPLWLTDPEYNIRLGTRHLRELLDTYHQDTIYSLAAYNAGGGAVNRWKSSFGHLTRDEFVENIPYQETRDYVKKIVAYMSLYRALYRIQ